MKTETLSTWGDLIEVLEWMVAVFPDFEITDQRTAAFNRHFSQYTKQELLDGIDEFTRNSGSAFAPSFAQLHDVLRTARRRAMRFVTRHTEPEISDEERARNVILFRQELAKAGFQLGE